MILHCVTDEKIIRARLEKRQRDASDADWRTYLRLAEDWEPFSNEEQALAHEARTDGDPTESLNTALQILEELGLHESKV